MGGSTQNIQSGAEKSGNGDSSLPGSDSGGYKELVDAMNALKSTVTSQLKIPPPKDGDNQPVTRNGTETSKNSQTRALYALRAQFALALETNWEVCKGFKLEGVVLHMGAEMTNDEGSAALAVRLEAYATIGDFQFVVSAELPRLQSGRDLDIVFRLSLRLLAPPDRVLKALQSITGGGDQHNASSIVDDSLRNQMKRDRMSVMLQLRVTRPASETNFRFNSLVFRFYSQIHWKPKLEGSKIGFELVDGDFSLVLAKDVYQKNAPLVITARLYGKLLIGKTQIDAVVAFSRDQKAENRLQFELQVLPGSLSAKQFLDELPTKEGKQDKLSKGGVISSLELPSSFSSLSDDLTRANLRIQLASSYSLTKSQLEYLTINIFARESSSFRLGFIDNAQLRNVVVKIEMKSWSILLSGALLLGKFFVKMKLVFMKGRGIYVQGTLSPNSDCSLSALARLDVFNDKTNNQSMDVAGHAKKVNTGGNPPFDLSRGVRAKGTRLSFDMLVLHRKDPQSEKQNEKQSEKQSYQMQYVKFLSHFDLDWQIIQDKVKFENLGICFDVRSPRQADKRKMAGLLYATWKLSKVDLFVYILGKKDSSDADFWAGLSVKTSSKESLTKAIDIINDPKFTDSSGSDPKVGLPVRIPNDLKANPEGQTIKNGLEFDGRLLVHFAKNKKEDKSFVLQDVSLHVDLEAPFTISGYGVVGSAFLDLRIRYPMLKEKRDFACYFKGGLKFENGLYLSIEAEIPMNNEKRPEEKTLTEEEAQRKKKLTPALEKIKLTSHNRKTKIEKYIGDINLDNEDMVFLAKVGKSEPQIVAEDNYEARLNSLDTNTDKTVQHDTSFGSFISSSYQPQEAGKTTQDAIRDFSPEGNPVLSDDCQSGTHFAVVLVARRVVTLNGTERKLRALAATLTSTKEWYIIPDRLSVQDVGLSVIITYNHKQEKHISGVIQGTLCFKGVAALATRITYLNRILTITAVAEINISNLLSSLGTEQNDKPELTDEISGWNNDKLLMVGIEANFEKKTLQTYQLDVITVPDFKIVEGLTLRAIWFTVRRDRTKYRPTSMTLGGRLLLNNQVELVIEGTSSQIRTNITWEAHKVSPVTIIGGMIEGGISGCDFWNGKPEFPPVTGFSDWEEENRSDVSTSGSISFFKENGRRQLQSARLEVSLLKASVDNAWELIDGYIKLKKFSLFISIVTVAVSPNGRKGIGAGINAEFYLMERDPKQWASTPDSINLSCRRSELTMSITPKPGRTIGDIIWCVTSGFLDIPSAFDLPAFPLLEFFFDWKSKEGLVVGYLTSEGDSWKVPGLDYVAKIKTPSIRGTIKKKGRSSTRVSIAGKLSFLRDLIELNCEYVLPTGPFLVEDHDIKKYYEMVTRIWNAIKNGLKRLRHAGEVAGETATAIAKGAIEVGSAAIGAAIGGLIGGLSKGGKFLRGVGSFILGVLLGGAGWLSAKSRIIKLLKKLGEEDGHDTRKLIDGFLDGVSSYENDDAKGNDGSSSEDPRRRGDDKSVTIAPYGDEKYLKRLDIDKDGFIELTGSGTCAGIQNQNTEFFVEYKQRRSLVKHTVTPDFKVAISTSVQISVDYESKSGPPRRDSEPFKRTFNTMIIGKRYRIPWHRPLKSATDAYSVSLTAAKTETRAELKRQWNVSLVETLEQGIAPDQTIFDLPKTFAPGSSLFGYIFLMDPNGNLRQGVNERDIIGVSGEGFYRKFSLLQNGYKVYLTSPIREGSYTITVKVLERPVCAATTKVASYTTFDSLVVQGSGMTGGKAGEQNLSIAVIDKYHNITETDHLIATVAQGHYREEISFSPGETDLTKSIYTGKYSRPGRGEYTLRILVNGRDVAGSPFSLVSTEGDVPITRQKKFITIPQKQLPAKDVLNITIDFVDSSGSSEQSPTDPLLGWQLEATPVDEDDNELTSLSKLTLGPLRWVPDSGLAKYIVKDVGISTVGRYRLSLLGPPQEGKLQDRQSFDNSGSEYVTITPARVATSFFVSGDGLQTGWEMSSTEVHFLALDQYGQELSASLRVYRAIISADGKICYSAQTLISYEGRYFVYKRPRVKVEGDSEAYLLRIVLKTATGIAIEAQGSPFRIISRSYFNEVNFIERSFWLKDRFIPNQLSWATLFVRDTYNVPTRLPPSLYILESPDYTIKDVVARPDGGYRVWYVAKSNSVSFRYYLDGVLFTETTLPNASRPLWEPVETVYRSPLRMLPSNKERIIARYTAKESVQISDLTTMLYDDAKTWKTFFLTATRISADTERPNTYCVWAILDKTGSFNLRPSYRGLSLTSSSQSHDIQIVIEFASYLFFDNEEQFLTQAEKTWASAPENVRRYNTTHKLSAPRGNMNVETLFNILSPGSPSSGELDPILTLWPAKLTFTFTPIDYSNSDDGQAPSLPPDNEADWRLTRLSVLYDQPPSDPSPKPPVSNRRVTYGLYTSHPSKDVSISLTPDERITKMRIVTTKEQTWVAGIILETSAGKKYEVPEECAINNDVFEATLPEGCVGLKGFWGGCGDEWGLERLGAVWSR
ncbi:hypothetical protein TWF718_006881 [Orbilia javanica]|uniref:Uncharacterized protein n=1 Tax=Orbilia javanica TaxID=47235 RepID=A0AAN8MXR1_9PEZI